MSKDKTSSKYFGVGLSEITKREGSVIPNIIYKLTNCLLKNGLEEEGIFRINGSMKVVEKLMNHFDKKGDADLSNMDDPASVASLLKLYLRELPDTLIPASLTHNFVAAQEASIKDSKNLIATLRQLVSTLPIENFVTLKYLCAFLVLASKLHSSSKMNANALSTVFGPNIFKCGPGFAGLKEQGVTNCIMLQFINKYQEVFVVSTDEVSPHHETFSLEILRDELKKQKNQKFIINSYDNTTPSMTLTTKQNSVVVVDTHDSNNKSFVLANEAGDGFNVEKINNNKKEENDEIKVLRLSTNEVPRGGRHTLPSSLLSNEKRRCSLESEVVLMSEIVLSEIDKVIRRYIFNHPRSDDLSSGPDDDGKNTCVSNNIHTKTTTTLSPSKNKNNNSFDIPPTKLKAQISKHVFPSPSDDEDDNKNNNDDDDDDDDDDDESTTSVSDNDDDDDDNDSKKHSTKYTTTTTTSTTTTTTTQPTIKPFSRGKFSTQKFVTQKNGDVVKYEDESFEMDYSSSFKPSSGTASDISFVSQSEGSESTFKARKLKKKIQGLQKKLKVHEDEQKNGKKDSSDDLSVHLKIKNIKKDLEKSKAKLEEFNKEATEISEPTNHHQHSSVKETFDFLVENLQLKRFRVKRPEDPKSMSPEQLAEEKTSLQKALLKFEQIHGRPNTSTTKGIMMPLYDRYRIVKRLLNQISITGEIYSHSNTLKKKKNPECSSEHWSEHRWSSGSSCRSREKDEFADDNTNLHRMSLSQLVVEFDKMKEIKKNLQSSLQLFEQQFEQQFGRKILKADQLARANEYRQYSNIKSKLKLLEVLISKHQRQSADNLY